MAERTKSAESDMVNKKELQEALVASIRAIAASAGGGDPLKSTQASVSSLAPVTQPKAKSGAAKDKQVSFATGQATAGAKPERVDAAEVAAAKLMSVVYSMGCGAKKGPP